MNIVLIGFKNCGKTSVGHLLATKLNRHFIDTDRLIETHYLSRTQLSRSVCEIFQVEGENFFRALETTVIASLNNIHYSIIATGGGSVLNPDNVHRLKTNSRLIYLHAAYDTLLQRNPTQQFPIFLDKQSYQLREPIYLQAADNTVDTRNKSINAIATEIIDWEKNDGQ